MICQMRRHYRTCDEELEVFSAVETRVFEVFTQSGWHAEQLQI